MTLRSAIVGVTRQKVIRAIVIDVLGAACSVRLGATGTGKLMRGLPYIGLRPTVGALVYVNYSTGQPQVMTSMTEDEFNNLISDQSAEIFQQQIINYNDGGKPVQPELPEYHHNDFDDLQGGLAPDDGIDAEYYHLTAEEYTDLQTMLASGTREIVTNGHATNPEIIFYDGDILYYEPPPEGEGS